MRAIGELLRYFRKTSTVLAVGAFAIAVDATISVIDAYFGAVGELR